MVNVSDPSSRLMPTRRDFLQGYNAQLAVTADQIIVAVQVGQSTNDQAAFVPMMHATQQVGERLHQRSGDPQHAIGTVLADAGYASDANLAAPGPDRLIALGKARDQAKTSRAAPALDPAPTDATPRGTDASSAAHRRRCPALQTPRRDRRARYRERSADPAGADGDPANRVGGHGSGPFVDAATAGCASR